MPDLSALLAEIDPPARDRAVALLAGRPWPLPPASRRELRYHPRYCTPLKDAWPDVADSAEALAGWTRTLVSREEFLAEDAGRQLSWMGEVGRLVLLAEADHPSPSVRRAVLVGLGHFNRIDDEVSEAIARRLDDPDAEVRRKAAGTFQLRWQYSGRVGVGELVAQIRAGLEEVDLERVVHAVGALAMVGSPAGAAGPALAALLRDMGRVFGAQGASQRHRAIQALREVASCRPSDVPLIAAELDAEPLHATLALQGYGRLAAPYVPTFSKLLDDDDDHVRLAAAQMLARLDPGGRERAVRLLVDEGGVFTLADVPGLPHVDEGLRRKLDSVPECSLEYSRRDLATDSYPGVVSRLHMLAGCRGLAADLAPEVAALLDCDEDPWVQLAAARALDRIAPETGDALDALVELAGHRRPEIRKEAALVLARCQGAVAASVARIEAMRTDPDEEVATAAAFLLAHVVDPAHAPYTATLNRE